MPNRQTQAFTHLEGWDLEATPATRLKAGAPTDADFYGIPRDGFTVINPTTGVQWARIGGTWMQINAPVLDYVEFTAPVNITAVSDATANTIVTGSAIPYDGLTTVEITFSAAYINPDPTAAGRFVIVCLFEDGSNIGRLGSATSPAAASMVVPGVAMSRRFAPAAGSHTYSIRAFVNAGTGVVNAGAGGLGAYLPGFIKIRAG